MTQPHDGTGWVLFGEQRRVLFGERVKDQARVEFAGSVLVEQLQQLRGDAAEIEAALGHARHEDHARGRGVLQPAEAAMLASVAFVCDEVFDVLWVLDALALVPAALVLGDDLGAPADTDPLEVRDHHEVGAADVLCGTE